MEPKRTIVALIGSHGTGKTTLANALERSLGAFRPPGSWTRTCKSLFGALNKQVVDVTQLMITFGNLATLLSSSRPLVVAERLVLDNLAYSMLSENITAVTLEAHRTILRNLVDPSFGYRILWVFMPIEFEMERDGVRLEDTDYRLAIERLILSLGTEFGIEWVVAKGSVDQRTEIVESALKERGWT